MTPDKEFDVDQGNSDDAPPRRARRGLHPPAGRTEPARRGAALRTKRREATRPDVAETAQLPLIFRPGLLLFLGAVVLGVLWSGGLFARGAEASQVWAWELFLDADGAFAARWDVDAIYTLLGGVFVLFFLIAAFSPARKGRGMAVLTATALAFVTLPPLSMQTVLYVATVLLAIGAGAVLAREGLHGRAAGKGLVFVALLLLAANLFFPVATFSTNYESQATNLARDLFHGDTTAVLLEPSTAILLAAFLAFLVAFLSWIGLGGRWAVWLSGLALFIGALAPLGLLAYDHLSGPDSMACLDLHQALVLGLPVAFLAFVLPTAAGVIDATRD